MSLIIRSVNIRFLKTQETLIKNLTFEVKKGETITLMGPSGCGKSTFLSYICGSLSSNFQATGEVFLDTHSLTELEPEKRKIGILYQDPLLFPHMNIFENLAFGIPVKYKFKERKKKVLLVLEKLDMCGFERRFPNTLSGGQQARIALMRTLLSEPKALLLDEPFSKLDASLKDKIRKLVFSYAKENQLPTVLVTHDIKDAEASKGKIINLQDF